MIHLRTIALALGVVLLAAPALAQTGASSPPLPGTRPGSPTSTGTSSPTLTPRPPIGAGSAVDPSTGLQSSQPPTDPRTGLPSSPAGTLSPPPPAPLPVPMTGPPRSAPPAGQPITPSTVDPRTGLPR